MEKELSPSKLSGGGGFYFEDKVASFFMTFLLSDTAPLDIDDGVIKEIHFQVKADGWSLDDLLIILKNNEFEKRIFFSIKSNEQFTSKKAPVDFVNSIWEQYHNVNFNKETDELGIIVSSLPHNTSKSIHNLLSKIKAQPSDKASSRLSEPNFASQSERDLFKSFNPANEFKKKHNLKDVDKADLLKKTNVLEFDFENLHSLKLKKAQENCKKILVSNSIEEADKLWKFLLVIAAEMKIQSGYINYEILVGLLKNSFKLKFLPKFDNDWKKLRLHSNNMLNSIPTKIANKITINRDNEVSQVLNSGNKIKFILGNSGTGKTVLTKLIAQSIESNSEYVWISATDLERNSFSSFESSLSLDHPLKELFSNVASEKIYLIIDGIDRIYSDTAFKNISIILNYLNISESASPWELIVTCQTEDLDRVQAKLKKNNVYIENSFQIEIDNFRIEDLKVIIREFPKLQPLLLRPHLIEYLSRPKILDLIAENASKINFINKPDVNEVELIDWIWNNEIINKENGQMRSSFMQELARFQGDKLQLEISINNFPIEKLLPLQNLQRDKICIIKDEHITFTHDLFGDWSRLKCLIANESNIKDFIYERLNSPLWHKAIGLYSLRLLEKDVDSWKIFLNHLTDNPLAKDLIFESIYFSSKSLDTLEYVSTLLIDNNQKLLSRLLKRFLHTATRPKLVIDYLKDLSITEKITLSSQIRTPIIIYWPSLIKFLHNHISELNKFDKEVATIVDTWLRFTTEKTEYRHEAAELGIYFAEHLLAISKNKNNYFSDTNLEELIYRCGISACHEFPDRVINFCLIASGREKPSGIIQDIIEEDNKQLERLTKKSKKKSIKRSSVPSITDAIFFERIFRKPWKYGARYAPNISFQKICLDSDALYPLIKSHPEAAKEIILALLIQEPPKYRNQYGYRDESSLCVEKHFWSPPIYFKSPLNYFLNNSLDSGLDLIIKLVNFVTIRWKSNEINIGRKPAYIEIKYKKQNRKWYGDFHIYYGFRDTSIIPDVVATALMVLEKWLYDNIKNETALFNVIDIIYRQSKSLAFAGLIISLGKLEPLLFKNLLFPFLNIPMFYFFDYPAIITFEFNRMIAWSFRDQFSYKIVSDWNNLPLRKIYLEKILINFILNPNEFELQIPILKKSFLSELERNKDTLNYFMFVHKLLSILDGKDLIIEDLPLEIQKQVGESQQESYYRGLFLSLPSKCIELLESKSDSFISNPEEFHNYIQVVENIPDEIKQTEKLITTNDVISGIISVLFVKCSNWLIENSEIEANCRVKLIEIINSPGESSRTEFEGSFFKMNWNTFCSYSIPLIWAKNPNDKIIRQSIAKLASQPQYSSLKILVLNCIKYKKELDNNVLVHRKMEF